MASVESCCSVASDVRWLDPLLENKSSFHEVFIASPPPVLVWISSVFREGTFPLWKQCREL